MSQRAVGKISRAGERDVEVESGQNKELRKDLEQGVDIFRDR